MSTHERLGLDSRVRGNDIQHCETPWEGGGAFLLYPFTSSGLIPGP